MEKSPDFLIYKTLKVKGKSVYGKWSSKMKMQLDDGGWFGAC